MRRTILARYVNPWKYRRELAARHLAALLQRDGDNCARCRRPLRFDLPTGHCLGAKIEEVSPSAAGVPEAIDNLCLTHRRCNADSGDSTAEVTQRVRAKGEAAQLGNSRAMRRA